MFFNNPSMPLQQRHIVLVIVGICMLAVHPDAFTLLAALTLMIPVGCLFISASGLLFGRSGWIASTAASCALIATVLIYSLTR